MIPFLENRKVSLLANKKVSWLLGFKHVLCFRGYLVHITKFPFHVFDRYETHIQAFGDVLYGKFIISRSSSSQNITYKVYARKYFLSI